MIAESIGYVQRRGELIAQETLLELGASYVAAPEADLGFDYLAFFPEEDGSSRIVAVEVKATEREIKQSFDFATDQLAKLRRLNLPSLILLIDAKRNEVHYAWAKEQEESDGPATRIRVKKLTSDESAELRGSIERA